jgi:RNA polymerase sigma-70 factor (ECF subfamily)
MPPPQSAAATDADLIARWQRGDENAATELVLRHGAPLARFLAASGGQQSDLDDLVQESFLRAFRSLAGFRGQCQFRTWLLTIGSNVLKDAGRRAARSKVVPLDENLQARGGTPHDEAVAAEAEGRLTEALTELPRLQREVFLLRAQQGMEYDEIAGALNTTAGAARVHYHHAVKRLRERLQ